MLKLVSLSLTSNLSNACSRVLPVCSCNILQKRTLLGAEYLRLGMRAEQRQKYLEKLRSAGLTRETYIKKLQDQMREQNNMMFWLDLNILMTLARSADDVKLALAMLQRLRSQTSNPGLLTGFVRNAMRMLSQLQLPDQALDLYREPYLQEAFNKSIDAVLVLMDCLYESERYDQVLEVYTTQQTRTPNWKLQYATYLYAAACYRLSNTESLEKARKLIMELAQHGTVGQRELSMAVMLAVNLKQFDAASELEKLPQHPNDSSSANIFHAVRIAKSIEQSNYDELSTVLDASIKQKLTIPGDLLRRLWGITSSLKTDEDEAKRNAGSRIETQLQAIKVARLSKPRSFERTLFTPVLIPTQQNDAAPEKRTSNQSQSAAQRVNRSAGAQQSRSTPNQAENAPQNWQRERGKGFPRPGQQSDLNDSAAGRGSWQNSRTAESRRSQPPGSQYPATWATPPPPYAMPPGWVGAPGYHGPPFWPMPPQGPPGWYPQGWPVYPPFRSKGRPNWFNPSAPYGQSPPGAYYYGPQNYYAPSAAETDAPSASQSEQSDVSLRRRRRRVQQTKGATQPDSEAPVNDGDVQGQSKSS